MRLSRLRARASQRPLAVPLRAFALGGPTETPIHERIVQKRHDSSNSSAAAADGPRIRPRRSALYMPGSRRRALQKARTLAADCIIMDLEDAVAPDAKETARTQIVEEVQAGGYGNREIVVRVNGLHTKWFEEDVRAAATSGADAVLLPKTELAADVSRLQDLMAKSGAPASMEIWCMIETPLGVLNASQICSELKLREQQGAHRRGTARSSLTTLCMGFADLGKELHAPHVPGRHNFATAAQLCVLAARAYGLTILDGVHLDLDEMDDYANECLQGAQLGMDGKTLIHPKQIEGANEAFAPSTSQVESSRRMIAARQCTLNPHHTKPVPEQPPGEAS